MVFQKLCLVLVLSISALMSLDPRDSYAQGYRDHTIAQCEARGGKISGGRCILPPPGHSHEAIDGTQICNETGVRIWYAYAIDFMGLDLKGWYEVVDGTCSKIEGNNTPWVHITKADRTLTPISWEGMGVGKTREFEVCRSEKFSYVKLFGYRSASYPCDRTDGRIKVTFQELPKNWGRITTWIVR